MMKRLFAALVISCGSFVSANAAEVCLLDSTLTFTESHNGFFYIYAWKLMDNAGSNWASPNDYYNGTWNTRYEIISYPSSETFRFCTCLWSDVVRNDAGGWVSYHETCSGRSSMSGTTVQTQSTSPSTWWTMGGAVDFARVSDMVRLGLVMFCGDGKALTNKDDGCWERRGQYLPMTLRLTIVLVSSGSQFSGWDTFLSQTDTREAHAPAIVPTQELVCRTLDRGGVAVSATHNEPYHLQLVTTSGRRLYSRRVAAGQLHTIPHYCIGPGVRLLSAVFDDGRRVSRAVISR